MVLFVVPVDAYLDLFTSGGDIYRTTDGSTWQLVANAGYADGTAYLVLQGDTSFFLTQSGLLLRSTDQGNSWTPIASYPVSDAVDLIYHESNGYYFLLTQSGDLYRGTQVTNLNLISNLGGTGFVKIVPERLSGGGTPYHYAVTSSGDLYRSTDNGSSWSRISNVGFPNIVALTTQQDTLQVLTYDGNLLRSTNRGASWTLWSTISQVGAASLVADKEGILFLCLETGELAWYRNGSWHWLGTPSQTGVLGMATSGPPTIRYEGDTTHPVDIWKVYPNPGRGLFRLAIPAEYQDKRFTLHGPDGRLIRIQRLLDTNPLLDLRHLPSGTYFLRIGDHTLKVVKD